MATVPGDESAMAGYVRELQELRNHNKHLEENLERAGELGKMLLEENESKNEKIEELTKANEKRLEMAVQEKYDLQMKLEQKTSQEAWFNEEITHLRQQLADEQDNLRKTLETEKNTEISKLSRQIDELRADLEHQHHTEATLHRKNEELEELLQQRLNQTETTTSRSFSNSEEIGILQEVVVALQSENTSLKSQMIEKKSELQSIQSECETLRGKLICRDEELDDIRCQFTGVNNALENARMEKLDLNCQLDALRMETSNHKKKGNSIFSEVEDRRVEAEKKLISLQMRCETLQEKFNVEKQQNQKYKRHISQLLMRLSTGKVDHEYVEDLKTKLIQAKQEVRDLMEQNKQLQDKQEYVARTVPEFSATNEGSDQEYVVYLQTVISGKEKELQKIKEELRTKNLQLLDEQSRTLTQNSRIQEIEREKDKIRSLNVKLQMRLDELRMKYEPESVKKSGVLVVKRTEKIPVEDSTVKITETSHIHDNSTINQSQRSFHQGDKQQNQPLVESQTENIQNGPIIKKKGKTVSISNEVEEHEITCEQNQQEESVTENMSESRNRPKGKRLTTVKHVTASKQHMSHNECKSQ